MGIRTHLDLISGQTVERPFGAPDSGCVYRSVPCRSSIANLVETAAASLHRHGLKMGIEGLVVAQDAPGDTAEFVGQGDASLFLCNRSDAVFSHAPKLY